MATARVVRTVPDRQRRPDDGRRRHLRVVDPKQTTRLRFRLSPKAGVVITVLLFVALFGVAVSHTLLIESQVELDALDKRVADEQARYEELRRDVAGLESPDRIVDEASGRLGMVPPDDVVWVTPDDPAPDDTGPEPAAEGGSSGANWTDVKPFLEPVP